MPEIPTLKGRDGFEMPIHGFGTWQSTEEELGAALECALEAGYRHIDAAYVYMNEGVVGKVINEWINSGKLTRDELFITTKLPVIGHSPEHVEKFLNLSLERLQLDYVDLYLIHVPFALKYNGDDNIFPAKPDGTADIDVDSDLIATWKKMEEMVDLGKTKYIGVSNFNAEQVGRLLKMRIPPVVNQIQLHVYLQQPELVKYLQDNEVIVTSYSTLGTAGTATFLSNFGIKVELPSILSNEVVKSVAAEVGRSPAQVLLRHMIQKQISVIPKSVTPSRIQENIEVFDFELSDEQMSRLNSLDKDFHLVDFRTFMIGIENHPEYPFKH